MRLRKAEEIVHIHHVFEPMERFFSHFIAMATDTIQPL